MIMFLQSVINGALVLFIIFFSTFAQPNEEHKPAFLCSWLEDQERYVAGDTAAIKIKILGNFDPNSYKIPFNPNVSVNEKIGNSTYISGLSFNFGGDLNNWSITFVPILVGVFNVFITDDAFAVLDSSLHFIVDPGAMHPSVSIISWMDYVNEFTAGTRAMALVQPKDAFGNDIPSSNTELSSIIFNVTASYNNNSAANIRSVTFLGWNSHAHLRIEFIASSAGDLLLFVHRDNQSLRGSPLPFRVYPGPIDVAKCVAKWKYGTNASQLFSKMEVFIYQLDFYGNIVPGSFQFDAEIVEKGTNLSIPIADLTFKEFSPGIQLLSFSALEPGNFLLIIYNAKHNIKISNMPYEFTVSIGYCDGFNSIINGSGLNRSVAGEEARFQVYLKDKYQYPSPVETSMVQVQITRQADSSSVLPTIYPLESFNGSRSPWRFNYDTVSQFEVAPLPSVNNSAGITQVVSHAYDVAYTPERSGVYEISVLCGNIPLNGGHSFQKEVQAGEVNMSLSGVIQYSPKTQKLTKNEVIVQLVDSFSNPVLSQQSKLKLKIVNHTEFITWMFADNNDGFYTGQYQVNDVGAFELCASFDGNNFLPCPFGVYVYSSEYFPRAHDDLISVWEDESISFNALGNDYFAGDNATIIGFSNPFFGSLLKKTDILFRYTPFKGYYGNDSFSYTIRDINGNLATASVHVTVLSIPPQFVSFPTSLKATEDIMSPKFGGFHGIEITYPDTMKNIVVTVSANSGTVSLSPMLMQIWQPMWSEFAVSKDGPDAKAITLSGPVEVINMVLQSIQYFGDDNFYGEDTIKVSAKNKKGITDLNVTIQVEPVNDPPIIISPEYIILDENIGGGNASLIFDKGRNNLEFLIGDPDLLYFPGNKSQFLVILSMEVTSGTLEAVLPLELINSTELKLKNSHQWQPLQTFVTISKHFVIRARGLRFHATIDDCNIIVKQIKYHVSNYVF
ncbi:hypothetical protein RND81_05G206500 [Saponaria officinalis]|uniref:GEX2 N-terminal Ig-like domain-containing protein n=1 Tax=Saponaria officinalis TaxID=3572 RepID=A0AAW1L0S6_SAPOF